MTASMMNWERMRRRRAPSAMRTPISRVRSATETSMMFMTPMPPTTRASRVTAKVAAATTAANWLKVPVNVSLL